MEQINYEFERMEPIYTIEILAKPLHEAYLSHKEIVEILLVQTLNVTDSSQNEETVKQIDDILAAAALDYRAENSAKPLQAAYRFHTKIVETLLVKKLNVSDYSKHAEMAALIDKALAVSLRSLRLSEKGLAKLQEAYATHRQKAERT